MGYFQVFGMCALVDHPMHPSNKHESYAAGLSSGFVAVAELFCLRSTGYNMGKGGRCLGNDVSGREYKENSEQAQDIFDSEPTLLDEIVMERLGEAEDHRNLSLL